MTDTIHYDKPVENLIDALSRTGHVTHTKYKKKSVTFHHNASVNASHGDVLNTWRSREASAHFDVDRLGHVAQYVLPTEYAWAVGNTLGNQVTISIELTNSKGAPDWEVSETTWKAGARLAAWLFVHVIEDKPDGKNVLQHQHWSSTACPGPYMNRIWAKVVEEVRAQYHHFTTESGLHVATHAHTPSTNQGTTNVAKIKQIQRAVGITPVDGKWGNTTDEAVLRFRKQHLNKF